MRRHLSWILCSWLFLQLAGIVSPVALAAAGFVASEVLCTCPDTEPGATCPMHHENPSSSHHDDTTCRMQSTHSGPSVALLSLEGGMGVLPSPASLSFEPTVDVVRTSRALLLTRADLPDAPPPRH